MFINGEFVLKVGRRASGTDTFGIVFILVIKQKGNINRMQQQAPQMCSVCCGGERMAFRERNNRFKRVEKRRHTALIING